MSRVVMPKEKQQKTNDTRQNLYDKNTQKNIPDSRLRFTYNETHDYPISKTEPKSNCSCDGRCPRCVRSIKEKSVNKSPASSKSIQRQTKVSMPGDIFEQEADRVAQLIVRMPYPKGYDMRTPFMNGKTVPNNGIANRDEINLKQAKIQISRTKNNMHDMDMSELEVQGVNAALSHTGSPLDQSDKDFMESSFGADFSKIMIHTGEVPDKAADALEALSFTVGNDIVFAEGFYEPKTSEGRKLLAHELTHALQNDNQHVRRQQKQTTNSNRLKFGVHRLRDGNLIIVELWYPSDTQRIWIERTERKYIKWRFGKLPLLLEANLLGILQSAVFTPYDITPEPGKTYALKVSAEIERRLVVLFSRHGQVAIEKGAEEAKVSSPTMGEKMMPGIEEPSSKEQATPANEQELSTPIVAEMNQLDEKFEFSVVYLQMMEHFGGLKITPDIQNMTKLPKDGLSAEEIGAIIDNDAKLLDLTRRYIQGVIEYSAFRGSEITMFSNMMETILEQVSRRNPTAVSNNLAIGRGRSPNSPWGIFHRQDWLMYYDEFGQPLPGISGIGFMDKGYVGATPAQNGINISRIEDPALRGLLNALRQEFGESSRMAIEAGQHLFENLELVKKEVERGFDPELAEKFKKMLPVFLGFVGGKALSTFLMRSPNPQAVAVGIVLHGLLEAAGYLMGIDFTANTLNALSDAGYHISRLRLTSENKLTSISQRHLSIGSSYLRHVAVDIALLAGTIAFASLLGAIKGKSRVTIECTDCLIKTESKIETGKEMERRMLESLERPKAEQTPERFTLRGAIKKGEPDLTLRLVAKNLQEKIETQASQAKTSLKIDPSVLDQSALSFILQDPVLAAEWTRLNLVRAARENPSIRSSSEYQALPTEYKVMGNESIKEAAVELPRFEPGTVGGKKPDVIDFFLDENRAIVTDITKNPSPWHMFKTHFYARVIQAMTGLKVDAVDITGHPFAMPKVVEAQ